jgi:hypothetical protein
VLQAYQQAACEARATVQQTALRAAAQLAETYGACAVMSPTGWLQRAEVSGPARCGNSRCSTGCWRAFVQDLHGVHVAHAWYTPALLRLAT